MLEKDLRTLTMNSVTTRMTSHNIEGRGPASRNESRDPGPDVPAYPRGCRVRCAGMVAGRDAVDASSFERRSVLGADTPLAASWRRQGVGLAVESLLCEDAHRIDKCSWITRVLFSPSACIHGCSFQIASRGVERGGGGAGQFLLRALFLFFAALLQVVVAYFFSSACNSPCILPHW
jgi:hypothetical protein